MVIDLYSFKLSNNSIDDIELTDGDTYIIPIKPPWNFIKNKEGITDVYLTALDDLSEIYMVMLKNGNPTKIRIDNLSNIKFELGVLINDKVYQVKTCEESLLHGAVAKI